MGNYTSIRVSKEFHAEFKKELNKSGLKSNEEFIKRLLAGFINSAVQSAVEKNKMSIPAKEKKK
jgi:hypothetical protein